MNTRIINDITIINNNEVIIKDTQSALDFIMTVTYDTNCTKIVINKEAINILRKKS